MSVLQIVVRTGDMDDELTEVIAERLDGEKVTIKGGRAGVVGTVETVEEVA